MDVSKMKNMVVLKNLPSNIVDEAFVVLKSNKKVKKLEKVENIKKTKGIEEDKKDKEYVLKEAEMIVADYILNIEKEHKSKDKKISKKSNKVKLWAYVATFVAVMEGVILFY